MSKERSSSIKNISEEKPNNEASPASTSMLRECDFCGRQFSSGKALGGHRRFHLQALRKMAHSSHGKVNHHDALKRPYSKEEEDDQDNSNNSNNDMKLNGKLGSFCCCICKKEFPSKKSLFGHMRSHPEREWRGVNPPFQNISSSVEKKLVEEELQVYNNNNNGSSSSSLSAAEGVVDVSVSCSSSWFKKDKRGRRSIGGAEAADNLVFLSRYGNNFPPPPPSPPPPPPIKKGKKNKTINANGDSEMVKAGSEIDEENWKLKDMTRKKRKKDKKLLLQSQESDKKEDLPIKTLLKEEVSPSSCYECSICHKFFRTFQALGGHRSRHNKDKNIVGVEEEEAHKVCIKNETFSSTSSALGGDNDIMKCISTGLSTEDEEKEDRLLSESGEASQSVSKILDFDLNEPYVMEDGATN